MLRKLLTLSLVAALGATATAVAAKPTPPTIAQLAAFPRMSSFDLSPDGKRLVALEARGEDRVILVWKTDALNTQPTVIGSSRMKIQRVQFAKDDVLAVTLWQPFDVKFDVITKTFATKLYFTDLEGKDWREPLPLPRARSEADELEQSITTPDVLNLLVNDKDHVLVVNNVGANAGDVFKVNVRTNRAERIQRREDNVGGYVTDLTGELRGRTKVGIDGTGPYVAVQFKNAGGGWEEHFRSYVKDRDVTEVMKFTRDPNIALLKTNVGQDKAAIYEYDVARRAKGEVVFQHRFFEADDVMITAKDGSAFGEVAGLVYDGPRGGDVQWLSAKFQNLDRSLRQALNITPERVTFVDPATGASAQGDYDVKLSYRLLDYVPDLSTVLLVTEGPNVPPTYFLLKDGKLAELSKQYPDVDPAALGTTKLIYYKARDGLDVPAFLTTPNVELCGAGPWKAVVHPHGGPWSRDHMSFDSSMWVPLMASRCMAVLQPQFRGSQGWSRHLWKAGDAEWGQKMQDDKDDGAKWMIDQKIAQPGHIAMFGFSYGGYSAMAAAVRPNGLYKCAIAGAGVSDIRRITKNFYTNPFFRESQEPTMRGLSPVDQADQIKIPIMVYHGDRDQTVPIEQSEWYVSKAKRSGQDVVYHDMSDYAHGQAWTREIFGDQLTFIDDYLRTGCGGGGL